MNLIESAFVLTQTRPPGHGFQVLDPPAFLFITVEAKDFVAFSKGFDATLSLLQLTEPPLVASVMN